MERDTKRAWRLFAFFMLWPRARTGWLLYHAHRMKRIMAHRALRKELKWR
jgi:hypothetical protein